MEEKKLFSIVEALKFGFYTVVENILYFLTLWLACAAIFALGVILITIITYFPFLNTIIMFLREHNSSIMSSLALPKSYFQLDIRNSGALLYGTIFFGLLIQLLYRFLSLGFTRICLDFYDYQTSTIKQLLSGLPFLLRGFITGLLFNIIVSLGTFFFIIPGIILAIKFGFWEQVLVDQNTGILESLKRSNALTQGAKWSIFGLLFIFVLINLLAMLFLGLGLLITYPAFSLAQTYVYRKLNALPIIKNPVT